MDEVRNTNKTIETAYNKQEQDYQNHLGKLNDEEIRLEERFGKLNETKLKITESNGNANAADTDIVEINAGGKIIAAKRSTLTQIEGSRLESLFCGRWEKKLQKDSNGRIFLDVNPLCFQAIVDFLNELVISSNEDPPSEVKIDHEYQHILDEQLRLFGVLGVTHPPKDPTDSTTIQNRNEFGTLHHWLDEEGCDGKLELLFRSSRDGLSKFHLMCDNKGPTITIIKTEEGMTIGGFANASWSNKSGYVRAENSFLYFLRVDGISYQVKFKLKMGQADRAVYSEHPFGPIFGGHDLIVHEPGGVRIDFGQSYDVNRSSLKLLNGSAFKVDDMEVFQVVKNTGVACVSKIENRTTISVKETDSFMPEINDALNAKLKALKIAEKDVSIMERRLEDEENFVRVFASGETKDVVHLNVSGTTVATARSTLQIVEESVLARQFDDSTWTEQGNSCHRVKEWSREEVSSWVGKIEGVPNSVGDIFEENEITGRELLALGREGLEMLGINRTGTVCLLLDEIKKLERASQDVSTFIEHSPYCFEKILDFLRLKRLHSLQLAGEPDLPRIRESEEVRFRKVVKYYFPGESSKIILE